MLQKASQSKHAGTTPVLSRIGLQTLLLGATPLAFLVSLLVLSLIVQQRNAAIAA